MITFEVNVLCDGNQCEKFFVSEPADQADAHGALVQALNLGWAIRAGKHLCPKCAVNQQPK